MRGKPLSRPLFFLAIAVQLVGVQATGLLGTGLSADAKPPIVLGFHETPVFLGPHEHAVTALAFSPDGKELATCGDSHLRLWDCSIGRLKSIHAYDASRGISGLAYSPDGSQGTPGAAYRGGYDPTSGVIDGVTDANGNPVRLGDQGNLSVLGDDSWKWLLVGPVVEAP